ncbi:MAG: RidA family protein [Kordiimonas sp.]
MRFLKIMLLSFLCGVTAVVHAEGAKVEFLKSAKELPTNPPFSEAVRAGDTLYLSGQLGIDPATGKLAVGGIKAEAKQTMKNIKTTLERHGYGMEDLVKCTVMLADISEWGAFNEEYRPFFGDNFPARSAFAGSGLALGARVEVECLAFVG